MLSLVSLKWNMGVCLRTQAGEACLLANHFYCPVVLIYTAAACTSLPFPPLNNPTVRKPELHCSQLRQGSLEQEGRHPSQANTPVMV